MTRLFAFLRRRPMILRDIDARAHELRTETKMATQTRAARAAAGLIGDDTHRRMG